MHEEEEVYRTWNVPHPWFKMIKAGDLIMIKFTTLKAKRAFLWDWGSEVDPEGVHLILEWDPVYRRGTWLSHDGSQVSVYIHAHWRWPSNEVNVEFINNTNEG
jgi:hypothetical protein